MENSFELKENRIFYSTFIQKAETLNEISIYLLKNKTFFSLNFLIDEDNFESTSKQFIPIPPNNIIDFEIKDLNYFFEPKVLKCNTKLNDLNLNNQTVICPSFCQFSSTKFDDPYVCELALKENLLPEIGGLINYNHNRKISRLDNYHLGLNYLITDLKLGYYEDIKKNFFSRDNLNKQNFIFKLNNYKEISEKSFIFYKKQFVFNNEFAISDIKLVCDNAKVTNPFHEESNENMIIDKLHDMVNGFTLWIKKIRVSDLIITGSFIEDVNLRFFNSNFSEKQSIMGIEFSQFLYTLDTNKFVCQMNKNIILLEIKKNLLKPISKYSDYDSSCKDTYGNLNIYFKKFNTKQVRGDIDYRYL